jgi:hypothetical protein
VFQPLVQHQFIEPHIEESNEQADLQESEHNKGPPVQTVFNTPSDYRQMALDIKRELEREEGPAAVDDDDEDHTGTSVSVYPKPVTAGRFNNL